MIRNSRMGQLIIALVCFMLFLSLFIGPATAEEQTISYKPIPQEITTPEKVKTKLGTLIFPNGYPSEETAQKLSDEMLYLHGIETFVNSIQGVSMWALRKGFAEFGIQDNEFIVFPEMIHYNFR